MSYDFGTLNALLASTSFTPSDYQKRAFEWIGFGSGSAILVAVAGSGKTKTLELALALIPERLSVQLFAFNTEIAKELNRRIDGLREETGRMFKGVRASTFHSVGLSAIARKLGRPAREVNSDRGKLKKLFKDPARFEARMTELYLDFVPKLVSFAKGEGIGALIADSDAEWLRIINHHDLYLVDTEATVEEAIFVARKLLALSNEEAKNGWVDFDDHLYLPLLWRLRLWQNDWVLVDEAQDTNPVRRAIAKLALRPGGRLLAVGDPRQAIYGFTGATANALDLIKTEFAARELPLHVCYRCAASIVRKAAEIVPYLQAAPGAVEGIVEEVAGKVAMTKLEAGDAVLCRNVAPLMEFAFRLIGRGVPCHVLGREVGEGLVSLVEKMRGRGVDGMLAKLDLWASREIAKATAAGEEEKAEAVSDRVGCIRIVAEQLPESDRTIPALVARIANLFADDGKSLTLSSIHKAKGREWRRVAVLRPDLSPSRWARQEHQIVQESNLEYVRDTRAMEHLMTIIPGTEDLR